MLIMKRVRRLIALSWTNQWLLVQSMFWLISIKLGLYIFQFQTLRDVLAKASQKKGYLGEPVPNSIERVVWSIEFSSRYLPVFINCLPKALAAQVMLSQRGQNVEVIIGARRNQLGQLQAHAWVEFQGKVIVGNINNLSQFSRLRSAEDYNL